MMRINKNTTGDKCVMLRCECGEIGIRHFGYHGKHLCVKARLICKDCNTAMKVFDVEGDE